MTNLRCTADHHAVPHLSTYDMWRAGSSRTIFQPVEKLIPFTTTSQSGPDQPLLYCRPTHALPDQGPLIADPSIFPERGRAGVDRLSGVNGPLVLAFYRHLSFHSNWNIITLLFKVACTSGRKCLYSLVNYFWRNFEYVLVKSQINLF